jgi:hypothetical protein
MEKTLVPAAQYLRMSMEHQQYSFANQADAMARYAAEHGVLGRPSWIEPCGKSFGKPKPNCAEYIYRNSFAPLVPEYYSVSLDTNGHVVDKYVYESP